MTPLAVSFMALPMEFWTDMPHWSTLQILYRNPSNRREQNETGEHHDRSVEAGGPASSRAFKRRLIAT